MVYFLALTLPVQDLEFYSTAKPTPYESDCPPLSDIENNSKERKFVTGTLCFYTNRFCLSGQCCGHKGMFTLLHFSLCWLRLVLYRSLCVFRLDTVFIVKPAVSGKLRFDTNRFCLPGSLLRAQYRMFLNIVTRFSLLIIAILFPSCLHFDNFPIPTW